MRDFPVVVRFPMHWGDMDALGHANNVMYFRWFESARMAYFYRIKTAIQRPQGIGPILATTTCDFLKPLVFPTELVVGARVVRVGHTSFHMEYAVARAEAPDTPHARGSGVIVMVDYKTGEKCLVPSEVRQAIDLVEAERMGVS